LPFSDGLTTAMSIVAQYLQVHKRFENWLIWVAADLIYAFYIFPVQKLYVSAVLYLIFTVLAILGAVEWWKLYQAGHDKGPIETT
jgi:nicotinamide mononucleotide transporter